MPIAEPNIISIAQLYRIFPKP